MIYTIQLDFWAGDMDDSIIRTEEEITQMLTEIIDYESCCASQNVKIIKVKEDWD